MSLSDEERLSGMYHAIRELTGIAHSWREDHRFRDGLDRDQYSRVRDLVDSLWPVFLGSQSNGLHWIMGSDSSNPITHEPTTPWAMAITGHLEDVARKINREDPPWENPDYKPPFNAIEFTNIQYLLSHCHRWEAYGVAQGYVFRIYQWVEQLIYYLRRYNDDFLARFKELSEVVAKIQGECYRIFSQNPNYAKAYLIREMMDILYGQGYPYDPNPDVVTQILIEENLHHDFTSLMKWPLETLAKHHVEMVRARVKAQRKAEERHKFGADEELLRLRLFKTIEFSRKSHEYEHIRKSIVKLLEDSPLAKYIPEVEKEWNRLAAEFKEKKEDKDDQYSDDSDLRALYAYGPWRGHEFMSDFLENEGLHPRKNKKAEVKKAAPVKRKAPAKKVVKKTTKKKVPRKKKGAK